VVLLVHPDDVVRRREHDCLDLLPAGSLEAVVRADDVALDDRGPRGIDARCGSEVDKRVRSSDCLREGRIVGDIRDSTRNIGVVDGIEIGEPGGVRRVVDECRPNATERTGDQC
jgi:hypothetical protein